MSPTPAFVVWFIVSLVFPLTTSLHIQQLSVIRSFPHEPSAFTEGLCFAPPSPSSSTAERLLIESTGIWRASTVRITDLHTGRPVRELRLTEGEFGEGVAVVSLGGQQTAVQLTYQNGTAYEYPLSALLDSSAAFSVPAAMERVAEHPYPPTVSEGWGLASWPGSELLYMSDGSNTIHVLHSHYFRSIGSFPILFDGPPQQPLPAPSAAAAAVSPLSFNELELLSPELLLANLHPTRCLALRNVTSKRLLSVIQADGDGVQMYRSSFPALEVMNGIAYQPNNGSTDDMLLVTGKMWPAVYQVRIKEHRLHTQQEERAAETDGEQLDRACAVSGWTRS